MKAKRSEEKIHIVFILAQPLLPLKGASFNCYRRAVAFSKLGFKVTILSSRIPGKFRKNRYDNLKLHKVRVLDRLPPKIGPRFIRHMRPLMLSWLPILFTLTKERPHILHVINPPDVTPMIVSIINRFLKIPFVFHMSDPGPESILSLNDIGPAKRSILLKLSKIMEFIIIRNASGLITVNDVLRRKILESRKIILNKPFITQYNVSALVSKNNDDHTLRRQSYVLYIGTLSTEMIGLSNLIHHFKWLWEKHRTKLFIIGDGPLKKRLIEETNALQAENYVTFLGYIAPQNIPEYVKYAKLCVIPYLDTILTRISLPTKLFEFISMGKTIVYPAFPGFTEILGTENPGMYRSDVPGDMIRTIDNLLSDNTLNKRTEYLNKKLSAIFSYNKEIQKILNLYTEICPLFSRNN